MQEQLFELVLAALSSSHICLEIVVRRPKVISKDFLRLALRNEMAPVIGLVGCAGSVVVVGWDCRSASAGGKDIVDFWLVPAVFI